MLVVMKAHATEEQVRAVCQKIEKLGYRAHPMPGATRTAIGITGNQGEVEAGHARRNARACRKSSASRKPYKLVSRDVKEDNTRHSLSPAATATIGGPELAIIAGPCAIESREQAFAVAERVQRAGAQFFRGGAYKPRTSPYSFQGLGEEGLQILAEIREQFGLQIVTEAIDNESLRPGRGVRRRHPDRRAQHAEFLAAEARRTRPQAGAAEARHVGDAGRVPDGGRVHHERGQLQRDPVRARRAHLRRPHPQHARPERRSGGAAA